jgi:hypothetical protein
MSRVSVLCGCFRPLLVASKARGLIWSFTADRMRCLQPRCHSARAELVREDVTIASSTVRSNILRWHAAHDRNALWSSFVLYAAQRAISRRPRYDLISKGLEEYARRIVARVRQM